MPTAIRSRPDERDLLAEFGRHEVSVLRHHARVGYWIKCRCGWVGRPDRSADGVLQGHTWHALEHEVQVPARC